MNAGFPNVLKSVFGKVFRGPGRFLRDPCFGVSAAYNIPPHKQPPDT
jgi:hypothetical protein